MTAIEQMMQGLMAPPGPIMPQGGLLGPQITPSAPPQMPMPQAAPMPHVEAPPQPMIDRIKRNLASLPGRAADMLGADESAGYQGLLSPDEMQTGKSSPLWWLLGPTGKIAGKAFAQRRLDHLVQMKALTGQIEEQRAAKQKQAMVEAQRLKVGRMFAPMPNETPRDTVHRAFQTALELYRGGDIDGAKAGFSVLGSMSSVLGESNPASNLKEVPGVGLVRIKPDGTAETVVASKDTSPTMVNAVEGVFEQRPDGLYSAATGKKWTGGEVHPVAMQPSNTYIPGTDDKGNTVIYAGATKGQPSLTSTGVGAKQASTGFAAMQKVISQNTTQMAVIDDALKELGAHEDAVGLKRGLGELPLMGTVGDTYNQRKDPGGVAARAQLSNVASLIIHDRSGAAVTVSEYPRLAPFVPKVTDTPDAIRIKLGKLRAAIAMETKLYQEGVNSGRIKASDSAPSGSTPPSYEEWKKSKGGP